MEFDFGLVTSWGTRGNRIIESWAQELSDRGYSVAIIAPNTLSRKSRNIEILDLAEYEKESDSDLSPDKIENKYDIPSLVHLSFTERQYFNLSLSEVLSRSVRVAEALEFVFSKHSFEYILQDRGPEIHRLLIHYMMNSIEKATIWAGFSPFLDTLSLSTSLNGSWDDYKTIPYEEIPKEEIRITKQHIKEFREKKRFYDHMYENENQSQFSNLIRKTINNVLDRDRPGDLFDQIKEEVRLKSNKVVNNCLFPTVDKSKRLCQKYEYAFLPLQYPIESRLTIYSPQFFRQEFLIEYLSRILPSSTKLFVKPHPSHPGRPPAKQIYNYSNSDSIFVLNPHLDSHFTIEHSEGVVVTNNTVGFETIYHKKPLFTLGQAFYSDVPASTTVSNLGGLPQTLSKQLSTSTSEPDLVSSIYSLRNASYDGNRATTESEKVKEVIDSVLYFCDQDNL
jgi:hypothetical protein